MLFVMSAVGLVAAVLVGLDGLMLGSAGELERIIAVACFALAAAGLVGVLAGGGRRAGMANQQRVGLGGVFQAVAVAPIMALSVGVFLATLIPAMYVMLPFFAVWWLGSAERRPDLAATPAPSVPRPLQVPA